MNRCALIVLSSSMISSCIPDSEGPAAKSVSESVSEATAQLALLAGVSGRVTTLAFYSGGGRHPGANAIDVGAAGGTPVWHQMDYLTPDISGGWIWVDEVREAGFCSQWSPGSPHYNGSKIVVFTYFYDVEGNDLGWHRAAYQHVSPNPPTMARWWQWNNKASFRPAWEAPEMTLGDQGEGGLYLGEVFGVPRPITNGPGGGLCTDGSHLHQESDGARASQRRVGEQVSERYSDLHVFVANGGFAPSGEPPERPFAAPPPPVEPVEDPCASLGYAGTCSAAILTWCQDGEIRSEDCVAHGQGCGWQDDNVGYNCVGGCGDLDYRGACLGSTLRWCESGRVKSYDCERAGLGCNWQDDRTGNNCL